jgi:hypothetical protein
MGESLLVRKGGGDKINEQLQSFTVGTGQTVTGGTFVELFDDVTSNQAFESSSQSQTVEMSPNVFLTAYRSYNGSTYEMRARIVTFNGTSITVSNHTVIGNVDYRETWLLKRLNNVKAVLVGERGGAFSDNNIVAIGVTLVGNAINQFHTFVVDSKGTAFSYVACDVVSTLKLFVVYKTSTTNVVAKVVTYNDDSFFSATSLFTISSSGTTPQEMAVTNIQGTSNFAVFWANSVVGSRWIYSRVVTVNASTNAMTLQGSQRISTNEVGDGKIIAISLTNTKILLVCRLPLSLGAVGQILDNTSTDVPFPPSGNRRQPLTIFPVSEPFITILPNVNSNIVSFVLSTQILMGVFPTLLSFLERRVLLRMHKNVLT